MQTPARQQVEETSVIHSFQHKTLFWNFHAEVICEICEASEACETKMVVKKVDLWFALSVTCHEKDVLQYFWAQFLAKHEV